VNASRGHVKNLQLKVGAHSRLEAVVITTSHGMVGATFSGLPGGIDRRRKR